VFLFLPNLLFGILDINLVYQILLSITTRLTPDRLYTGRCCKIVVVQTGYLTREELKLRLLLEVTRPGVDKDDKSTQFPVSV
jgi:hypothetical protein